MCLLCAMLKEKDNCKLQCTNLSFKLEKIPTKLRVNLYSKAKNQTFTTEGLTNWTVPLTIDIDIYQPLHSGRIWHKVNF